MGYASYWRDKAEQLQATLNAERKAHSDALTAKDSELAEARAALVKAAEPLEAMIMAGTHKAHSYEVQAAIEAGAAAVRTVLSREKEA